MTGKCNEYKKSLSARNRIVNRRARDITTRVMANDAITVMTLDLQLYDLAMKLWVEREDIRKQFLFRPGELHVVFWALAALGKYIEGSGIDQAWIEAGIYSPTTVSQILNGKHMYRALEAHTVTLLALYDLYFQSFLSTEPEERAYLQESSLLLREAYQEDINGNTEAERNLRDILQNTLTMMESRDMTKKMEQFQLSANKIQRFILNYMKQFETTLLFIRSTRQRDVRLHMESIESLTKYFFAHDHLNYARLLPLYIATMQETEKLHPELWREFMKGNFCVTKGLAAFTSISPDHGIEQENRALKVIGGIVGITQNEKALDKFFLIAPVLSKSLDEFAEGYGFGGNHSRKQHHEVTGGKLSRVMSHASKLSVVLREHGDPFDPYVEEEVGDEVYNLLTKEVMNEQVSRGILERDNIGQQIFQQFVTDRLVEGNLSVWDKMTKTKLQTFKSSNATAEVRSGDKLIKVKEERGLLQRFVVIARSRPELDLKECIGTYELGIVPRSLFASDGSLLLAYDKAKILHHLEHLTDHEEPDVDDPAGEDILTEDLGGHEVETATLSDAAGHAGEQTNDPSTEHNIFLCQHLQELSQSDQNPGTSTGSVLNENKTTSCQRVIIIDGMALVNGISKTEQMKTCRDFAQSFIERLENIAVHYDEVRLVFDRYIDKSLKAKMRQKRTKGKSTYYHVRDSTLIQKIPLKHFLSNVKTKAELTEYLAVKCLAYSEAHPNKLKKFMVTSGTKTTGNTEVPESLRTHSHEEADTLLILHALTVDKDAEVTIDSPDTDIFLLLIHKCHELPPATRFITGKGKFRRSIAVKPVHDKLGEKCASAILGFHAFTGSDMSGRFAGRSKDWCFKVFLTCDSKIWEALESLGQADPSQQVYSQLERFVCLLYKSKVHTRVNELRWFLFSNRAAEGESLPPTTGSLKLHVQRAQYMAMVWRKAAESHPSLPSPVGYGWQLLSDENTYVPVRCLNPPAPEALMNLLKCGCKKGCMGRCTCRNNSIPCTEVCGCVGYTCNNKANTSELSVINMDEDQRDT